MFAQLWIVGKGKDFIRNYIATIIKYICFVLLATSVLLLHSRLSKIQTIDPKRANIISKQQCLSIDGKADK